MRRNRCRPGRVEITPRSSARFVGAELVGALDHRLQPLDEPLAGGGVPLGRVGVVADHEPLVLADLDLLHPQVLAHLLVAALARQRGGGLGRAGAQLLPEDVAVRARRRGGAGWPRR